MGGHCLSQEELPDPETELRSPTLQADTLPTEYMGISVVDQTVKRRPTMWETWVRSLGWEDPLEKEMANHSSILAWKIPRMEEPGRL